jgi:hypothetical protein
MIVGRWQLAVGGLLINGKILTVHKFIVIYQDSPPTANCQQPTKNISDP